MYHCVWNQKNQNVLTEKAKRSVVMNVETFLSQTQLILVNHCLCTVIQCSIFKMVLKQNPSESATAQEWNFLFGLAQSVVQRIKGRMWSPLPSSYGQDVTNEAYLKTYFI